jgi:hypothetical protein
VAPQQPLTSEQAIVTACEDVGLEPPAGGRALHVVLADGTVPFVAAALRGQGGWRVELTDLDSARRNLELGRVPYVERLTVWLAPTTGRVLKVVSAWPPHVPRIAPRPSLAEEEYQTGGAGERYTGLPTDPPVVNLFRAIKIIQLSGPGSSVDAKQIVAYYVKWENFRVAERDCWIVQMRGIPPFEASYPGVPEDARNHLRHIVDARTGEWLGASTVPQPTEPRPQV